MTGLETGSSNFGSKKYATTNAVLKTNVWILSNAEIVFLNRLLRMKSKFQIKCRASIVITLWIKFNNNQNKLLLLILKTKQRNVNLERVLWNKRALNNMNCCNKFNWRESLTYPVNSHTKGTRKTNSQRKTDGQTYL